MSRADVLRDLRDTLVECLSNAPDEDLARSNALLETYLTLIETAYDREQAEVVRELLSLIASPDIARAIAALIIAKPGSRKTRGET